MRVGNCSLLQLSKIYVLQYFFNSVCKIWVCELVSRKNFINWALYNVGKYPFQDRRGANFLFEGQKKTSMYGP